MSSMIQFLKMIRVFVKFYYFKGHTKATDSAEYGRMGKNIRELQSKVRNHHNINIKIECQMHQNYLIDQIIYNDHNYQLQIIYSMICKCRMKLTKQIEECKHTSFGARQIKCQLFFFLIETESHSVAQLKCSGAISAPGNLCLPGSPG